MNNAWNVREDHFKTRQTMEDKLKFFLEYAILAPSGYNNQPWKFKVKGNKIEIWTDLAKVRHIIDPEHRESYISAGTALGNLVLTAEYFGMETKVTINKRRGKNKDLDLSASLSFKETDKKILAENRKLFEAIVKRQTNRREFEYLGAKKLSIKNKIKNFKVDDGIVIKVFDEKNIKKKLGMIVADAGLYWYQREDFRKELISWLSDDKKGGGRTAWQRFYGGKGESEVMTEAENKAVRDEMLVNQASLIVVVGSKADKKFDWIKTGMELEKFLLFLTDLDVQMSYFNTIVQSDRHRHKLKSELGDKFMPQLFLRIGRAKAVGRSPRNKLAIY